MKKSYIWAGMLIFSLLANACAAQPAEPTVSADEIQQTAIAAAFTIVAETQAAIPTNTPLPPTDTPTATPLPTDTPIPSPTLDPLVIPTFTTAPQTSGGNTDPCNAPLPGAIDGHLTKIRLKNETKGTLVISLYLNKTPFGECGYRGYNLNKNDSTTITDLVQGCYNVSVFVTQPNKSTKAFGYGCINNPDLWEFKIYEENVVLLSP